MAEGGSAKTSFELLPREYYLSDAVFEQEYERLFSQDWIYAGHVSQLPEPGRYFMCDIGGEQIVVVRGEGDKFYAHLNVCAHRGYRLCEARQGQVRSFVCQYHQWRFGLDGSLQNAPRMRDGEYFDYSRHGLKTAAVEVWNGLIFLRLNTTRTDTLAARLAPFADVATKFEPQNTKLAHEKLYKISANWKVVVDNAMECYHCASNHRSLCGVIDVPRLMDDLKAWLHEGEKGGDANFGSGGMHVSPGMATMSGDGTLICPKLLGRCDETDVRDGSTGGFMVTPNFFYAAFYVDHWWVITIRPRSATETDLIYSWYVRNDAVEGVDYDVAKLMEVGDNTQVEDNILIERTQSGIRSRYYKCGPIGSDVEPALYDFIAGYKRQMGLTP